MKVMLLKTIKFVDFNNELVVIPRDTEVYIDAGEGIAFYNGTHFYIDKSEYSTMN